MTTPDLDALSATTREYAAFQARKSGLATALGGLLAILLLTGPMYFEVFGVSAMGRSLLEFLLLGPLVWLALKSILARLLYRDLGNVKAMPDALYERQRGFWILGLALLLMTFMVLGLLGFVSGSLRPNPNPPSFTPPSLWTLVLPLLYLIPTPWALRGIEEVRTYAVLITQCLLWFTALFLAFWSTGPSGQLPMGMTSTIAQLLIVTLLFSILIWSALAMVRGWKEHRQYLALLRSLPQES